MTVVTFIFYVVAFIKIACALDQQLIELTKENSAELLHSSATSGYAVIIFHESWCSRSRDMLTFIVSVRAAHTAKTQQTNREAINFYSVNTHAQATEWWTSLIEGFQGGLPRIVFYSSPTTNSSQKPSSTQYEYDTKSKSQFIYFMNLHFFNSTPQVDSLRHLQNLSTKFTFILLHNEELSQQLTLHSDTLAALAKANPLYTFIRSTNKSVMMPAFTIDVVSAEQRDNCVFAIILRKQDRFDQYTTMCDSLSTKEEQQQQLLSFFELHQKPVRINTFNMRVLAYLKTRDYFGVALFHRRKIFADDYLSDSFYNCTRDIDNVIHSRKEDTFSYISTPEFKNTIRKRVIFFTIDRFENTATKKLSYMVGEDSFEKTPAIFGFRFNNQTRTLERYPFTMKHSTFIISSEIMLFIHGFLNHRALEQPSIINDSLKYFRKKPLPDQIARIDKKVIPLQLSFFERSFTDRYTKAAKVDRVFNVILFFAQYSRESLAYLPLFSLTKNASAYASSKGIQVIYSLFDIGESDQEPFAFKPLVSAVPEVRIYSNRSSFIRASLLPAAIDKQVTAAALSEALAKQIDQHITNTLEKEIHRSEEQKKTEL